MAGNRKELNPEELDRIYHLTFCRMTCEQKKRAFDRSLHRKSKADKPRTSRLP